MATKLSWEQIRDLTRKLMTRIDTRILAGEPAPTGVYGIPTGGSFVAMMISKEYGLPLLDAPRNSNTLIVDDLVDSGKTMRPYLSTEYRYCEALLRKPTSPKDVAVDAPEFDDWIQFPWEHAAAPHDAVIRLLEYVGENPKREGLIDTPRRYLKALKELTTGYNEKPDEILSRVFTETYDQMVIVRGIEFWSLCEHHILPFRGRAVVGYVPQGKVLGLSKIARLVHCFARRLQVQERMTEQIAHALDEAMKPAGVGVLISGWHTCMAMRGIKTEGEMITSCLLGVMRDKGRAEFLSLAEGGSQ